MGNRNPNRRPTRRPTRRPNGNNQQCAPFCTRNTCGNQQCRGCNVCRNNNQNFNGNQIQLPNGNIVNVPQVNVNGNQIFPRTADVIDRDTLPGNTDNDILPETPVAPDDALDPNHNRSLQKKGPSKKKGGRSKKGGPSKK